MAPSLQLLSPGSDELAHTISIKNTFIDIKLKNARLKRSLSCPAKRECSEFDSTLQTLASSGPLIEHASSLPSRTHSLSSDGSEPTSPSQKRDSVSTACSETEAEATGMQCKLLDPVPATFPWVDSPMTSSEDEAGREDSLKEHVCRYLINTDNSGQTLMWHGLSTKFQVRPHLLNILKKIQATDVGYIYLPQNIWEKKGKPTGKVRNKGYAFIHFRTEAAASHFQQQAGFDCTTAVLQGISVNLTMLVSAPQKRTVDASVYLPNNMNELEPVPIHALRDLCGKMTNC
jgi:hypothetical protein